ncbi:MAG TPA: trypsin-like peptidase domain-containing protein [Gemmatimonadaceae bacterium]|nr:trypsin-like peptidase domain-containing protein [Gemmatimonadaceae bacterium]
MTIELRILSGSRAGQRARFDKSLVTVGRHPLSDLQFDPDADLDVSTRHAELREADGAWTVFDQQSTNGTFVNGERIADHRRLFAGDTLGLGEKGPQMEVHIADAPRPTVAAAGAASAPPRRDTSVRIAEAVQAETASLKRMFALAVGSIVVIALVAGALWQRRTSSRERELLALIARSESASVPLMRTVAAMQARDSQFSRLLSERDSALLREMQAGRRMVHGNSSPASVAKLSERVAQETRLRQAITQMDFPRVHDLNDPAVAMLASDLDGTFIAGTAFSISSDGLLVTNRHVVRTPAGRPPRRLRVLFANTTEWRAARVVRTSETDDLALLQVDDPSAAGPFPVVAGVSRAARDTRVGSPVASIGYPHAVDTPMEGAGLEVRARTTTTAGTVSKRLGDVLQIDSYAGKGSSGSPVFDVRGYVVGVIYGGEAESRGRIVYAVPAERLATFLAASGAGAVLR